MRGNFFISFEGGEGTGKSTQIRLLQDRLSGVGCTVKVTREPGGSEGAEDIRTMLVTGDTDRWTPMSEALLVFAGRVDHVERVIKPALKRGEWVLSDRFFDSTVAYQGVGGKLGVDKVRALQHLALGDFAPDLTLVLDIPAEEGLARAGVREADSNSGEDRFERVGDDYHRSLRQSYLDMCDEHPERCKLVSALGTVEEVAERIWQQVSPLVIKRECS